MNDDVNYKGREKLHELLEEEGYLRESDLRLFFHDEVYEEDSERDIYFIVSEFRTDELEEEDKEELEESDYSFKLLPIESASKDYDFGRTWRKSDTGNLEDEFEEFREKVLEDRKVKHLDNDPDLPDKYRLRRDRKEVPKWRRMAEPPFEIRDKSLQLS